MTNENEHFINIRSVQVYRGGFDLSFVNDDGSLKENVDDLDFHKEKSLSFTCSCGSKFNKWDTAANHLIEND